MVGSAPEVVPCLKAWFVPTLSPCAHGLSADFGRGALGSVPAEIEGGEYFCGVC